MLKCYYEVLEPGVAFVSPYKTFVFSTDPDKITAQGESFKLITSLLHRINCESLMDNYHEMMLGEQYIKSTLEENGYTVQRIPNLGQCRDKLAA